MMNQRTQKNISRGFLLGILLCIALIPAVSAFTATQSSTGTTLYNGDTISIKIDGLADGDQFTYRITSTDLQTSGNSVTLSGVNMPFAFQTGTAQTTLTTTGTTSGSTSLTVIASDSSSVTLPSSGNTISTTKNVAKDTYTVTMSGTKTSADAAIGIDYSVGGKVSAPTNPSTLSFKVTNVNTGHLTVEVLQGTTSRYLQTYTIIIKESTPQRYDTDSGGSSGGDAAGPAAGPAAAPVVAAPVVPAGVTATTANLQHNEQGQVLATYEVASDPSAGFASTLGITTGTTVLTAQGQPAAEVSISPMAAASVPSNNNAGFSFSGMAVECGPSGTQFSGTPATISFTMTAEQWASALTAVNGNTAAMTIQVYDSTTNSWSAVSTTVNPTTRTVSAQVNHFSMYALYYTHTTSVATSPKTIGELANLPLSAPTSVVTVSTSNAAVPTQIAIVATPTQNAGFFDGIANWFAQLFGAKQNK